MTIDKQINEITEGDLNALIAARVREGKDIEFKREINLSSDDAKRKFVRNVAAFANTQGGHIIFGIEEQDGVATSLHALPNFNEDSEKLRLRDLIRPHIEPKVYGFQFHAVPLLGGGHALVLWVPRGWSGPHMVTFEKDNRFYFRHGNGNLAMGVEEVRTAFVTAESLPGRLTALRLDRAFAISSGDVPMRLANPQVLVLHIIPVSALNPLYDCDLSSLMAQEQKTRTLLPTVFEEDVSNQIEHDFDSLFKMFWQQDECFGYTKLFRNGILEVTDSYSLRLDSSLGQGFRTSRYERLLVEFFSRWLESLRFAKVEPPAFAALSLIGMTGRFPFLDPSRWRLTRPLRPIRHDPLLIPPSVIESFDVDGLAILLPLFNRLWQASGRPKTPNIDQDGNWVN
jgi:Putative DNA-binding domain